ncbi:MAG: putative ABC exporter domain-containing protein [Gemmatimonadota bacterium]
MIAAFAYLIATSTRNKVLSQIKRVKNPRYAIALLLGLGYFWMVFFNQTRSQRAGAPNPFASDLFGQLVPLLLFVVISYFWIVGTDAQALAFTQAEVSLLFTAPVSRRALILYKLARAQAAVLTTTLIWVVIFRGKGGSVERALSYWVVLSIINTHRLGVALVRASSGEHGTAGFRKNWVAILLFVSAAAAIAFGFYGVRDALSNAASGGAAATAIVGVMTSPPVSWVLFPFRLAVAPAFAEHGAAWAQAMLGAVALFALHIIWVLRTDSQFEEAAAEASVKQAKRLADLRSRGVSGAVLNTKVNRRTIRLAPTGPRSVAIIWKNYLFLMRTGMTRTLIGLPLLCALLAIVFKGRTELGEIMVAVTSFALIFVTVIFGPMTIRNDLRGALTRLPMLKTMPLRGRQIMLAEIASSSSPTAIMQFLLSISGILALSFLPKVPLPLEMRIGILMGAPILLLGINLANFTIHNGLALLFPAWVRMGEGGTNGIEAVGQTMLVMIITLFMLFVLLIVPAAVGAGGYFYWRSLPLVAFPFVGIVSGGILAAEAYAIMMMLGGSLEKLEPSQVG